MTKPIPFLITCLLSISSLCYAQQPNTVDKLLAWKKLIDKHNIEKIHLHTNLPYYSGYDTVWFKAYVLNAYYNRPSAISKMLFVDLIDPHGKLLRHATLHLNMGLANGYLLLGDSLKSGNYSLLAYTNNMKAYGEGYKYRRTLQLKTDKSAVSVLNNDLTAMPAIQFFPEGGDLVTGIASVVGFKAIGPDGLAMDVSGDLVNEQGTIITSFNAAHLGIGSFRFTPQKNHQYLAKLKFADGKTTQVKLKDALVAGYSMRVQHVNNKVNVTIKCTDSLAGARQLTMVASQDGVTRYLSRFRLAELAYTIAIPDTAFYTGVTQLTIFDPASRPVAERLLFIDHYTDPQISLQLKRNYRPREKVTVPIDFKNLSGDTEPGSLSVTVYNESELPADDDEETSIYTDLLLNADLRGKVESPGYYFSHPADTLRRRHLDQLLLTQGWRRFSWRDQLSDRLPAVIDSIIDELQIAGQVKNQSGKPYVGGAVTLYQSNFLQNTRQVNTNADGRFQFADLDFADTAHFVLSTNTLTEKKKTRVTVYVTKPANEMVNTPVFFIPNDSTLTYQDNKRNRQLNMMLYNTRAIMLKDVQINAVKPPKLTHSDNLLGMGHADKVITADDLKLTTDLGRYLINNIPGLKEYNGAVYSRVTPDRGSYEKPPAMLVIYHGVAMDQAPPLGFSLSDINPNEIESVEVLKGALAGPYGINGMGGVLVINSKPGTNYTPEELGNAAYGILPITAIGYQSPKEFYSPQYSITKPATNMPDFRKAIYWNPNVVNMPGKPTEVSYYNSDYTGNYKIVIEGINADGQIARSVYRYEVK
jgi:hypothetical protein